MKTALVTGAAGFVGRHMVNALLQRGYRVVGVDIKHIDINHVKPIFKNDYDHYTTDCRHFFNSYPKTQFDLVVHLAALVGGRAMIENQPLRLAVDLELDAAMFQWTVATGQPRVVYYSSSAAYPTHVQSGNPPLTSYETMIEVGKKGAKWLGVPDMSYGWVKLTGEYLATLAEEKGVRVHVFRPFSGYGSDQDLTYPFPSFIRRALDRRDPFEIWGDGTQVRDWVHIDDVVAGTLACVHQDVKGPVNLCTGVPTDFRQLQRLVCRAAGYEPKVLLKSDMPAGVMYRVGDPTRMLNYYTPQITLERGIERAMEEMR